MNDLQPSKKLLPDSGRYDGPDILLQAAHHHLVAGLTLDAIASSVLAIAMILNRRYNGFWIDPSLNEE